jgi:RHS repeat-associated protein
MDQRLWYQQDANFNVTSVSNDATGGNGGVAVERYVYAAYGERTVLHSDFTPVASNVSLFAVDEGHQGLTADEETGLLQNRYRYLHVTLGRFTSMDPHLAGPYVDGMNGFEYERSGPLGAVDSMGLSSCCCPQEEKDLQEGLRRTLAALDAAIDASIQDISLVLSEAARLERVMHFVPKWSVA